MMTTDFSNFDFEEGRTYTVEVDPDADAVQLTEHGEGHPPKQPRYETLEFLGSIGSGPWRRFKDWGSEAEVTINAHHITSVGS